MHKKVVCMCTKKIQQLSGTYISETTRTISFKFGMQGCVYG